MARAYFWEDNQTVGSLLCGATNLGSHFFLPTSRTTAPFENMVLDKVPFNYKRGFCCLLWFNSSGLRVMPMRPKFVSVHLCPTRFVCGYGGIW